MEKIPENAITATYEDALKFIDNEMVKKVKAREKGEGPQDAVARIVLAAEALTAMTDMAAFVYGKTSEQVCKDSRAIAADRLLRRILGDQG